MALVFKPTAWESLYFSYGTSFDPSAEALTLTTKTANLGPVKATTYEAGSKSSLFDGGLLVTGALFHTEVDNAQINDPENPTLTVLQGNETRAGPRARRDRPHHLRSSRSPPATPTSTASTSGDVGTAPSSSTTMCSSPTWRATRQSVGRI